MYNNVTQCVLPVLTFFLFFCSNIGKLARTIKSRSHPEENLVNRYLLSAGVTRGNNFTVIDADEEDEDDAHPLVPLGAVNSTSNKAIQEPRWPKLTKYNSRFLHQPAPERILDRILQPYVGRTIAQRNHGQDHQYAVRGTYNPVHIGPWKFTTYPFDDVKRPKPGTNHSYFAIRGKNVIHHSEWVSRMLSIPGSEEAEWFEYKFADYDPEELLIGQFHRFIDVSVPGWKEADRVHEIGQCTLWQGLSPGSNDVLDNRYLRPFLREPGERRSNDSMIINIEEYSFCGTFLQTTAVTSHTAVERESSMFYSSMLKHKLHWDQWLKI